MGKKLPNSLRKLFEYSFYIFVFLFPWQTKLILRPADTNFNEISLYLSHLVLLVIIVAFFSYKFRHPGPGNYISVSWWAMAVLEVAVLVSFFFAPDKILAFYHYILFLMGIGVFYIVKEETNGFGEEGKCFDQIKIIIAFLSSLFLQAVLGIYQFLTQSSIVCKYLGLAGHSPEIAGTAVIETATGRWLRAYGGMDHPNIFGGVLAVSLLLAAYFLAKRKIIRTGKEIGESVFLFVFYFVALFSLFFTFSRTAWIAYALGSLVLLISLIAKKDRWIIGRYLALMFFSGLMLFIAAYPYQSLIQARIEGETRLEKQSIQDRREYLRESEGVIRNHLLTGVGVGNYPMSLMRADGQNRPAWDYQPVHNVFLLLWAECGLFALAAFVVFLITMLRKDRRAVFSAAILVALIVIMLFDHWLLSLPFGLLFLFFIFGLA